MTEIGLQTRDGSTGKAIDRLGRLIDSGKFPRYSRLPAERELATTLGVGRSTLRKALAIFEAEGKIWRHVGSGTYVGNSSPLSQAGDILECSCATPEDLLEARLVIEPAIAAFACGCARPDDIRNMQIANMKREVAPDPQTYNLWDFTFHEIIATSTRNPLFMALIKNLNALRKRPQWTTYKQTRMSRQNRRQSAQEHDAIITAIAARNAAAAYESMRSHINNVRAAFQSWHTEGTPPVKADRRK